MIIIVLHLLRLFLFEMVGELGKVVADHFVRAKAIVKSHRRRK